MTIQQQPSLDIGMVASGKAITTFCRLGMDKETSLEDVLELLRQTDMSLLTEDTKRFAVSVILTKLRELDEEEMPLVDINESIAQMPFDDDTVYDPFTERLRRVQMQHPRLLSQRRLEEVAYSIAVHNGQRHHSAVR